jgi:potassium efflux system protein
LARKLMMQAAVENPRVLRDPEPMVLFLTISASTFDYELRFHVRELADRNASTDEILTRIALSFREHNVETAFNQVEVMVKNLQGQELNLSTGKSTGPTQAEALKPTINKPAAESDQDPITPTTPAIDPQ